MENSCQREAFEGRNIEYRNEFGLKESQKSPSSMNAFNRLKESNIKLGVEQERAEEEIERCHDQMQGKLVKITNNRYKLKVFALIISDERKVPRARRGRCSRNERIPGPTELD